MGGRLNPDEAQSRITDGRTDGDEAGWGRRRKEEASQPSAIRVAVREGGGVVQAGADRGRLQAQARTSTGKRDDAHTTSRMLVVGMERGAATATTTLQMCGCLPGMAVSTQNEKTTNNKLTRAPYEAVLVVRASAHEVSARACRRAQYTTGRREGEPSGGEL